MIRVMRWRRSSTRIQCALIGMALLVGWAGASSGTASSGASPGQIFNQVQSGMLFVTTSCPSGTYTGSGFLVGPQVMITARHVVEPEDGNCVVTVTQEGTNRRARVVNWIRWFSFTEADIPITDFVTGVLDVPLTGHNFVLSPREPRPGDRVLDLGYSLGNPLSFNQGYVDELGDFSGIPEIAFNLLTAQGGSGGPILNLSGQVVGLVQLGQTGSAASEIFSLNVARYISGNGHLLCRGIVAANTSTVCPSTPRFAFRITACWVATTDSPYSRKAKIYQTSAAYPRLYFLFSLSKAPQKDILARITVTRPDGSPALRGGTYLYRWRAGARLMKGGFYVAWNTSAGPPGAGLWVYNVSLSNGSRCTYGVNFIR